MFLDIVKISKISVKRTYSPLILTHFQSAKRAQEENLLLRFLEPDKFKEKHEWNISFIFG